MRWYSLLMHFKLFFLITLKKLLTSDSLQFGDFHLAGFWKVVIIWFLIQAKSSGKTKQKLLYCPAKARSTFVFLCLCLSQAQEPPLPSVCFCPVQLSSHFSQCLILSLSSSDLPRLLGHTRQTWTCQPQLVAHTPTMLPLPVENLILAFRFHLM